MSARTVKQVVEEYLKNNDISNMERLKFAQGFKSQGSLSAVVLFEVKFTYQFDEIMNNRLDLSVLQKELQSDINDLVRVNCSCDDKKQYKTLIVRLSYHSDKVKELLTATEEEKLLEYKLYAKYRLVNKSLVISSMAKPSLLELYDNYYDIKQMRKDNQLLKDSKEFVFPFGSGILSGENQDMIVITPLSEKCRVLMYSEHDLNMTKISFHLGPEGTGKTETFKDFAHLAGQKTCVINCTDEMTIDFLEKLPQDENTMIIFDEFNRCTKSTIKKLYNKFTSLNSKNVFGIGMTFNPGYAGRTEMIQPKCDYTKINMKIPDYAEIANILLLANGLTDNRHKNENLSKLIVGKLRELEKTCSKQQYYDYGMRKLAQLINQAGCLKYQNPDRNDLEIVILSLKKTFSKTFFHKSDIRYGEDILGKLECTSLDEILKFRHGVIILTSSKYTTDLGLLPKDKCKYFYFPIDRKYTVNPFPSEQDSIEEVFDSNSDFVKTFRECSRNNIESYFVLHNMNPNSVENFNTVLDDNKRLCLTTGEVIPLTSNMRVIIIDEDCKNFSPATISRCGLYNHYY